MPYFKCLSAVLLDSTNNIALLNLKLYWTAPFSKRVQKGALQSSDIEVRVVKEGKAIVQGSGQE